jgi:TolA-binding protein
MPTPKLPADFAFLPEMYADSYFPTPQVDKVKAAIQKLVSFLEEGSAGPAEIQEQLDEMTRAINELQDDFEDHDSELETGAREAIAETVERILAHFEVAIDTEEALREREW